MKIICKILRIEIRHPTIFLVRLLPFFGISTIFPFVFHDGFINSHKSFLPLPLLKFQSLRFFPSSCSRHLLVLLFTSSFAKTNSLSAWALCMCMCVRVFAVNSCFFLISYVLSPPQFFLFVSIVSMLCFSKFIKIESFFCFLLVFSLSSLSP